MTVFDKKYNNFRIGFDFGTSGIKSVVTFPDDVGDDDEETFYLVDFSHIQPSNSVPYIYQHTEDISNSLKKRLNDSIDKFTKKHKIDIWTEQEIKIFLIEAHELVEEICKHIKNALYGIERYIGTIINSLQGFKLKKCKYVKVHLGVATENVEKQEIIQDRFAIVLQAIMKKSLEEVHCGNYDVETYAEIKATMAAYLFSQNSKEPDGKMYFMYDAGAGTLDFCSFSLIKIEDVLRVSILKKSVEWLGSEIKLNLEDFVKWLNRNIEYTTTKPSKIVKDKVLRERFKKVIPENQHDKSISEMIEEIKREGEKQDETFKNLKDKQIDIQISSLLTKTKKKKPLDLSFSNSSKLALDTFSFGGAYDEYWKLYFKSVNLEGYDIPNLRDVIIKRPESIFPEDIDDFSRYWVAYGLCLDEYELERIELYTEKLDDIERNKRPTKEIIGKEQM